MRCQTLSKSAVLSDDRKALSSIGDGIAKQQIKLLFRQITHQPAAAGGYKRIVGEKQHGDIRSTGNCPCFGNRARKKWSDHYVTFRRNCFLSGAAASLTAHCVEHHQLDSGVACGKQRQFGTLAQLLTHFLIDTCNRKQQGNAGYALGFLGRPFAFWQRGGGRFGLLGEQRKGSLQRVISE
jgi:hypothetical protein